MKLRNYLLFKFDLNWLVDLVAVVLDPNPSSNQGEGDFPRGRIVRIPVAVCIILAKNSACDQENCF